MIASVGPVEAVRRGRGGVGVARHLRRRRARRDKEMDGILASRERAERAQRRRAAERERGVKGDQVLVMTESQQHRNEGS